MTTAHVFDRARAFELALVRIRDYRVKPGLDVLAATRELQRIADDTLKDWAENDELDEAVGLA